MDIQAIQKTLELIRDGKLALAKATFGQPSTAIAGLQVYDLEAPAKTLVPRITPLRNMLPRVGGGRAIQANWRAVTGINTGKATAGVPEGKRNKKIAVTTAEYNAVFKTLSSEASATFQAQWAGQGFEDIQARARKSGLHTLFVEEERTLLAGNGSTGIALGTPSAPAGVPEAGGTMSARTIKGIIVALTLEGYRQSSLAAGVATTESRTPADGGSAYTVKLGSSDQSAASGDVVVAAGDDKKVTWTWDAVRGAFAYALYTGVAGSEKLAAITLVNTYEQLADESGAAQAATEITADNSQDEYVFDGLIPQIVKSGSNGYYVSQDGDALTADGKGGISEFDTLLLDRYNNYKITSFDIWTSGNGLRDLGAKIRTGSSTTPFSINVSDGKADLVGGSMAIGYIHPVTGERLALKVHPDLPDGKVLFIGKDIPYEDDRVPNVWQVKTRQEYFSIEWPLRTFEYEVAVAVDEVLQGYFPPANGMIDNALFS